MVTIKKGYNDAPLHIRLVVSGNNMRRAELWLIQEGLHLPASLEKYKETLSYISLEELLTLRDEINSVIKKITGV